MSSSDLHKKLVSQGFTPVAHRSGSAVKKTRGRKDYSPLSWQEFFDSQTTVPTDGGFFNVYLKGTEGPVLFLVHGGGYSGLTWACFAKSISRLIKCRIIAPDLRCHGLTEVNDEYDFSIPTAIKDIEHLAKTLVDDCNDPVLLMGHSMGGAFVVHAACENVVPNLAAVAVIDVVEGSAMDALQGMKNVLCCRPQRFDSADKAIEWCIRSGYTSNLESARVSMPSQIIKAVDNVSEGNRLCEEELTEEGEESPETADKFTSPEVVKEMYTWRIDLSKTEKYWQSWFRGLSQKFLSITVPKVLLLAGIDRLDKDLTIGHMQGKFQMIVLPKCGHAVQEDSPDHLADTVATFLVRNRLAVAIGDFHPTLPGC